MAINKRAIFEEMQRRAERVKEKKFSIDEYCFEEQRAFIKDPSKLKTAVCSRRSGKSEACAADLLHTALTIPRSNSLYVTLTRTSAERIIWRTLMNILADYKIKYKANNKDLTIKIVDTDSMIFISGAKDKQEIEKFRGMSLHKVYVDEVQSFKPFVKELVEDILNWATKDVNGTICLIGTPGPVLSGYFYDMSTKENSQVSQHHWNILKNPFIKIKSGREPSEILADELERKGITESDPTFMREALGLWVKDDNARVFKFDKNLNIYNKVPEDLTYIFGVDIGYKDADAISVLGYGKDSNNVYLIEEVVDRKQDITTLALKIKGLQKKYNPVKIVMDAGALGKKIQEEIRIRHGIVSEAAQKERKLEYIELLNDDLRTGRFKAYPGSLFEADSEIVVWEYVNGTKKVSDRTHSDVHDSTLYGWKECKHYFETIKTKKVEKYGPEWMVELEQKEAEHLQNQIAGNMENWGVDDNELNSIYDSYADDDSGFW